eukprot:1962889-Pyramimonas_sp.AAC.1
MRCTKSSSSMCPRYLCAAHRASFSSRSFCVSRSVSRRGVPRVKAARPASDAAAGSGVVSAPTQRTLRPSETTPLSHQLTENGLFTHHWVCASQQPSTSAPHR